MSNNSLTDKIFQRGMRWPSGLTDSCCMIAVSLMGLVTGLLLAPKGLTDSFCFIVVSLMGVLTGLLMALAILVVPLLRPVFWIFDKVRK